MTTVTCLTRENPIFDSQVNATCTRAHFLSPYGNVSVLCQNNESWQHAATLSSLNPIATCSQNAMRLVGLFLSHFSTLNVSITYPNGPCLNSSNPWDLLTKNEGIFTLSLHNPLDINIKVERSTCQTYTLLDKPISSEQFHLKCEKNELSNENAIGDEITCCFPQAREVTISSDNNNPKTDGLISLKKMTYKFQNDPDSPYFQYISVLIVSVLVASFLAIGYRMRGNR